VFDGTDSADGTHGTDGIVFILETVCNVVLQDKDNWTDHVTDGILHSVKAKDPPAYDKKKANLTGQKVTGRGERRRKQLLGDRKEKSVPDFGRRKY
jgi:hypothetical protein